jgi:two-component sensor histidine kinase
MTEGDAIETRTLLLTPNGRDADVALALLAERNLTGHVCLDLEQLCEELLRGGAAVVTTEEALAGANLRRISRWLETQPPWSDMPFIVLTRRTADLARNPAALRLMQVLGNVSFLERPFHPTTFVAMVQAALRARGRQLQTRRHLEQQALLSAELDHRVKNMLAVIQALVLRTASGAKTIDEFTADLQGRINAMSHSHRLLSESQWEGAELRAIVADELKAYFEGDRAHATLDGPDVRVRPRAATAVSMAIHELATNAAKYGALSVPEGRVTVRWRLVSGEGVALRWTESGGPEVRPPERRGFGSSVIERALRYEVDGAARLEFRREGVVCELTISERQLAVPTAMQSREPSFHDAAADELGTPRDARRVLVVEDSALVAMQVADAVKALGWRVVGPVGGLRAALKLAGGEPLDGAVLDINLDGDLVYPVAQVLQDRGVPFVFATGYVGRSVVPARFNAAPMIEKPFDAGLLQAALRKNFDGASA